MLEQRLHAAELQQQRQGGLGPQTFDTGHVVGGIAHERQHVGKSLRVQAAELLPKPAQVPSLIYKA